MNISKVGFCGISPKAKTELIKRLDKGMASNAEWTAKYESKKDYLEDIAAVEKSPSIHIVYNEHTKTFKVVDRTKTLGRLQVNDYQSSAWSLSLAAYKAGRLNTVA